MRDERIEIGALDDLRARSRERLLDIAVGAQLRRVRALAELVGLGLERFARLRRRRMLSPLDLQLLRALFGLLPAVGDDRDAGHQSLQVRRPLDDEGVLHAGHRLDLIEV